MMDRIKMANPIAELDGDEMTRILWKEIKATLLEPFVELNTIYFDLGLPNRDATDDRVTIEAAEAIKRCHVGVKCATITPNAQRVEEYHLKEMWKSPNGTIRSILDGTTFRAPILVSRYRPFVTTWKKPITIARHSYGDVYKDTEYRVEGAGRAELVFTAEDGTETSKTIFDFKSPGVVQGLYNRDDSIENFAHACFRYALALRQDLWFSAKDTISKTYDHRFKDIFEEIYERDYRAEFEKLGTTYFYTLIDDAVARVIRSEGGFVWALKNYDGDVMSDMLSTAFGSLAMMTSVLVSPDGDFNFEAAHGTITRHYYRYQRGEMPSSNPVATIFAWSGALKKRGELDGADELVRFADRLERATLETIESGVMTGDLAALCKGQDDVRSVDFRTFLQEIAARLNA